MPESLGKEIRGYPRKSAAKTNKFSRGFSRMPTDKAGKETKRTYS